MLLALTFINFQEQTFSMVEWFMEWLVQLPIVGEWITESLAREGEDGIEDGVIHMGTGDFKSFIFRVWAISSLVLMLAGMAINALFGPFKPWTLKRKIGFMGLTVLVLLAGFIANYFADSQKFNGGASGWMFNFSMISLLVFVVSSYCLSISHAVLLVINSLNPADLKHSGDSGLV